VTGGAKYASDQQPAGWLYGLLITSPYAAAQIHDIDVSEARKVPGIQAVVLHRDGGKRVRYYGEELGAVAGETKQACLDALRKVKIKADVLPHVVTEAAALKENAPRVVETHPNLSNPSLDEKGTPDAALGQATALAEGTFTTPVQLHHSFETHGNTVDFSDGQNLTAWASTQAVHGTRNEFADTLKLPHNQVKTICEFMGGGFGSKFGPGIEGRLAALLSKEAGKPVRLMLTRLQEGLSVGNRPSSHQQIKLGAGGDGAPLVFDFAGYGSAGIGSGGVTAGGGGGSNIPQPYLYNKIPNTRVRQSALALNTGRGRAFRAPGHPQASFGMEMIIDELCAKLKADPLEWRIKHDPSGMRQKQYRHGGKVFNWAQKYKPPGSSTGPLKKGVGVAGATWGGGGKGTKCQVEINPDGTVIVKAGTQDLGTGTKTVVAVVAAEAFGLTPDKIDSRIGSSEYPPSGGSGGSTTCASVAPAIWATCTKALDELQGRSNLPDARGANFAKAAKSLGVEPLVVNGEWQEGLSSSGVGGVQFAEVTVDTDTGVIDVDRIVCVQDCGLVIDPLTCQSQVYGGIIMGLSYALFEDRVMDQQTGVMLSTNFDTYRLAGIADMPDIQVVLLNNPERGVIGIGEPVTVPTASAIGNAVANALGVRIGSLPITPAKVLAALRTTS
jgi:xanthine dehydrogenase YagR molybdenum-binding subunit